MTEKLRTHKDLTMWKKSIKPVTSVYFEVKKLPQEELFGLTSQIKRSTVSIPSNIAEGFTRNSKKEIIQFLYISLGSLSKLETQLIIAKNLGYLNNDSLFCDIESIRIMLIGLTKSIKGRNHENF